MVPMLVHAYSYTRSTATGYSPYYLIYGWKLTPSQPVLGTPKAGMNATTSTKFVQQLHERLKWAYKTAQHFTEKETRDICYIRQCHVWINFILYLIILIV